MENLNRIHNMKILEDLSPGDLIEFPRGAYSHWGVYLGDEDVVHLAGEDNDGLNAKFKPEHMFTICGVKFDKARVCIDNFWRVVDKCKARRNNNADKKMRPLHPEQIIKNAREKVGQVGYSLIYSNCEHFAKWCRYGVEKSDQVETVMTGAAVGIASSLVLGVVYAFTRYFGKESEEEKEEEEEEEKKQKQEL